VHRGEVVRAVGRAAKDDAELVAAERDDVALVDVPVLAVERDGVLVQRVDEEVERLLVALARRLVQRQAGSGRDPAVPAPDAELVAAVR